MTKTICLGDLVPVHTAVSTVKEHAAFITELEFFNAYESPRLYHPLTKYCDESKITRAVVLQNKPDGPQPVLVGILEKISPRVITIRHRLRNPNLPIESTNTSVDQLNSAILRVRYSLRLLNATGNKRHG